MNLDEYSDIGTYWVALYVNSGDFTYFDSFGVEHKTGNGRTMVLSKCAICESKNQDLLKIKKQKDY